MASADITLAASAGRDFEADTTQRTATLRGPGGRVFNPSAATVWINENAGTVSTTGGEGSIPIPQNREHRLADECRAFTFKTASNASFPVYMPVRQ